MASGSGAGAAEFLDAPLTPAGAGDAAHPQADIVGAQILREYLRRFGDTETALQMYAGSSDETLQYAAKVLAERARLEQVLRQSRRSA